MNPASETPAVEARLVESPPTVRPLRHWRTVAVTVFALALIEAIAYHVQFGSDEVSTENAYVGGKLCR